MSVRSDLRDGRAEGFPLCCRLRFTLEAALTRGNSDQCLRRGVRYTPAGIEYVPCRIRHDATLTHPRVRAPTQHPGDVMPMARVCSYVGPDRRGCGRITYNGNRCELHPKPHKRSGSYTRTAAKVRANAETCWLCGLPFTDPNDPPVADHVMPRMWGGADDETNLKAAHRSCNGRRGQAMQW